MDDVAGKREQEIATLISLLDDPDDSILPVVTDKLKILRPNVAMLLAIKGQYRENAILHYRLNRMIAELQKHEVEKDLDAWSREDYPILLKGLWLVYRTIFPDVKYEPLEEMCMDMAKEVWVELTDNKTAVEKVHLYNHVFYHRIKFGIEDPFLCTFEAACLDKALARKQANPLLFGLIYLDVAFRCGLPIRAMAFPGGFLPVCVDENEQFLFYINIYNTGEIFGREQFCDFLSDFGISIPQERLVLCSDFTLAGIYAESLYFLADSIGNKELEQKMEQVLKLFGNERFLIMEEDEEE